jgi:F-type H+-transporting ATPase subunit epsilon
MASSFQLRIVTPKAQLLDEPVREVTAPGTLGEFGVLPDHIGLLSSLEIGVLTYKTERGTKKVAVRNGFAEVLDNVMSVLADDALPGELVDANAVRAEMQAAEAKAQLTPVTNEVDSAAEANRRWAQARLEAAR